VAAAGLEKKVRRSSDLDERVTSGLRRAPGGRTHRVPFTHLSLATRGPPGRLYAGGGEMEQTTTGVGQQQASVDRSLEATLTKFNEAFNRLDAKEVASFWADDGTVINPIGNYGSGRSGVERVFREDAESALEGTTSRFTITGARKIGADCVLLDLDDEVQNAKLPDGSTGPMKLHVVVLAQRKGEGWQWLDVRPYGFLPRPQRLH